MRRTKDANFGLPDGRRWDTAGTLLAGMEPNLTASQREEIRDMILSKSLTIAQMAEAASCSKRSIKSIRSYLHLFGTTKASSNGVGRPGVSRLPC